MALPVACQILPKSKAVTNFRSMSPGDTAQPITQQEILSSTGCHQGSFICIDHVVLNNQSEGRIYVLCSNRILLERLIIGSHELVFTRQRPQLWGHFAFHYGVLWNRIWKIDVIGLAWITAMYLLLKPGLICITCL